MSDYTKGPWKTAKRASEWIIQAGDEFGTWVAKVIMGIPSKEQKANAHLISAAPEMYEALKNLTRGQLQTPTFEGYVKHAIAVAESAIAKAEGRE